MTNQHFNISELTQLVARMRAQQSYDNKACHVSGNQHSCSLEQWRWSTKFKMFQNCHFAAFIIHQSQPHLEQKHVGQKAGCGGGRSEALHLDSNRHTPFEGSH